MLSAVKSSVRSTLGSYCSCVYYSALHSSSTWWEAFINIPGKSSPPHADSSWIYCTFPALSWEDLWRSSGIKIWKDSSHEWQMIWPCFYHKPVFQCSPFRANLISCELSGRSASVVLWLYWLHTQSNCLVLPAKYIIIHTDVVMFVWVISEYNVSKRELKYIFLGLTENATTN